MPQLTVEQAFHMAVQHHQAGQLQHAEALYRQILSQQPNHADALLLLGVLAQQVGRNDIAADLIRQAIAQRPNFPEAYNNLGVALKDQGKLDEAIAAFRQAIALKFNFPEAHINLGLAHKEKGQLDDAIAAYRQAIAINSGHHVAHYNLGNALGDKQQLDDALIAYRRAIALKPDYADAYSGLGDSLSAKGQLDGAVAAFRQAIALSPIFSEAYNNLGNALGDMGQHDAAMAAFRKAIALKVEFPQPHNNLGNVLRGIGQLDDAIAEFRKAIALNSKYHEAHNNLGNALKDKGQLDEAIAAFRAAIALKPDFAEAHSNLLMTMNYSPTITPAGLYQEARRWAQQHAEPLRHFIRPHANDRNSNRCLRIGYVSPDLWDHVAGRFLLPLLARHDHQQFEIFAYADVRLTDAMTERLRSHTDTWRNIVGMPDEAAAELIRNDRIDILMDLSGHSSRNRLLLFARKPAPVQATWLGYPGTTGTDVMDYRFTDIFLDPPGDSDTYCSEQLMRLPHTVSCYQPNLPGPELTPPPSLASGRITFGCLNNFCKVNEPMLATWVELLRAMPNSQLLLYAREGSHRQQVQARLAHAGLDTKRVRFVGFGGTSYFDFYRDIDIVLDPFPYTGSTTTCDALWMGVPVITLAGTTIVSRMSMALLSNVGRTEWIATSKEQYINRALELAKDFPRLAELRRTLRTELQQSPLMDASGFARDMEAAYRQMWRHWCAQDH